MLSDLRDAIEQLVVHDLPLRWPGLSTYINREDHSRRDRAGP
jgi:hypothetical protein